VDSHNDIAIPLTDSNAAALPALSRREREILEIISLGRTNRDVGMALGITVHAVKFHLASIYRKLGVANRTEAVVTFLRAESS
jgi:DNA-binding CsgD family transcriptional regulator